MINGDGLAPSRALGELGTAIGTHGSVGGSAEEAELPLPAHCAPPPSPPPLPPSPPPPPAAPPMAPPWALTDPMPMAALSLLVLAMVLCAYVLLGGLDGAAGGEGRGGRSRGQGARRKVASSRGGQRHRSGCLAEAADVDESEELIED